MRLCRQLLDKRLELFDEVAKNLFVDSEKILGNLEIPIEDFAIGLVLIGVEEKLGLFENLGEKYEAMVNILIQDPDNFFVFLEKKGVIGGTYLILEEVLPRFLFELLLHFTPQLPQHFC